MPIQFRPYQQSAIGAARAKIAAGVRRVLINAPTGSGKTVIAAGIVQLAVAKGKRVLFLAHRRELIMQTVDKLVDAGVLNFGVIMAGANLNNGLAPVQVASIQTLIRRELPPADLIIIDECLTGDSLISTEKGFVPIKDITPGIRAMSYNGSEVVYSEITDIWTSCEKEILEITVESGEKVRCTANHLFMTKEGWTKAADITPESRLLLASADAEPCCTKTNGGDSRSACQGINKPCAPEVTRNGGKSTNRCLKTHRFALAGVVSGLAQNMENLWNSSFFQRELERFTSTFKAMTGALSHGMPSWMKASGEQFLAPCLGTPASSTRTKEALHLASASTMAGRKPRGPSIKRITLHDLDARSQRSGTTDTGLLRSLVQQDASLTSRPFISFASRMVESLSAANGWIRLDTSALLGGSATMDQAADAVCTCTQRDSLWQKMKSFANGSGIDMEPQRSIPASEGTIGSICPQARNEKSCQLLSRTSRPVCNTNWRQVARVQRLPQKEVVYDITVAGTHCFFANGILTHNCHRANARSYLSVLANYPGAAVLGLSATPERTDGKGLDDLFADMIEVETVPNLIASGHLVKPTCYIGPTADLSGVKTRRGDYDEAQLSEAMDRPALIGDIVANWRRLAAGKQTVAFASSVEHAKHIAKEFMAAGVSAAWVSGDTPRAERDAIVADWKAGIIQVVANCQVFTEGYDQPSLECAILARPTQSVGMYLQQVGRVMRTAPDKDGALVLDHAGCCLAHGPPHIERVWTLEGMARKRKEAAEEVAGNLRSCRACGLVYEAEPKLWLEETQTALRPAFAKNAQKLLGGRVKDRGLDACPGCGAASCIVCTGDFVPKATRRDIDGIAFQNVASCPDCLAHYVDETPHIVADPSETEVPDSTDDELVRMGDDHVPQKVVVLNEYKRLINEARKHGRKRGWAWHRLREKYGESTVRECLPRHRADWWRSQA